jgi:hypothetical protein
MANARFNAVVDLPTPPLPDATQMICLIDEREFNPDPCPAEMDGGGSGGDEYYCHEGFDYL